MTGRILGMICQIVYCYSYSLSGHLFFSFFITLHYYFCHIRWFFSGFIYIFSNHSKIFLCSKGRYIYDIHENWPIFKNPHPLVQLLPKYFHPLDLRRAISSEPPCSQYQLINFVCWLSVDFYLFSWSQPHPQSYLKKIKTSFSPSSYSEQMCWGKG